MTENLAPWRSPLSAALHHQRSQPHSRYFQLATVTSSGLPANRTVVFRGFLDPTNQIKIITDARSQKTAQILHQPWGEICWYFTKTREQFRLAGKLILVTADYPEQNLLLERQKTWQNISDAARLQFTCPDLEKIIYREDAEQAFSSTPPSPDQPLPNFCLLLLNPEHVEHLELKGEPQHRWRYYLDEAQSWCVEEINP